MYNIPYKEAVTLVPHGWNTLVQDCYQALEMTGKPFTVIDVKEKFGELRFYWYFTDEETEDDIVAWASNEIENICARSREICEVCGLMGMTYQSREGLYYTACHKHVDLDQS